MTTKIIIYISFTRLLIFVLIISPRNAGLAKRDLVVSGPHYIIFEHTALQLVSFPDHFFPSLIFCRHQA